MVINQFVTSGSPTGSNSVKEMKAMIQRAKQKALKKKDKALSYVQMGLPSSTSEYKNSISCARGNYESEN